MSAQDANGETDEQAPDKRTEDGRARSLVHVCTHCGGIIPWEGRAAQDAAASVSVLMQRHLRAAHELYGVAPRAEFAFGFAGEVVDDLDVDELDELDVADLEETDD